MSSASFSSTSVKSTSPNPRGIDNVQEDPQQVSVAAALGEDIALLVQKALKELELRDHDIRSRTKSLVEKERKVQQREQLLAEKERAVDSKDRAISEREKKVARDEKNLQDERKRHTDHVKTSLASLQQHKQESNKDLEQRVAVLQQNFAEAAAERDALRDQLTQREPELSKEQTGAVHLHTPDERPPEHWSRYPQHYPQPAYDVEPEHEEEPPPQQAPYYPPPHHHHIPYPMPPQQFHPHAFKYPPPNRGYGYPQPFFPPMRAGYAPGMYPPPGVFPPRQVEPRGEPGEDENGEAPEWRDQGYGPPQGTVEEDHQDRQRSHLSNYPGQPQYPPTFWGADSQ